jgi:carbon monoxide dehydrogenase subunit G
MQLENEFTVPAPVPEVWKTLLDVQQIAPCLPGATVERVEGDEVAGRVKVKVGPITVSYAGTARFVTKDEAAHRFVLEASGRETRGSGTASATVEARMSEQGSGTKVTVVTDLDVTGKPAQFGRGVMADVAGKLTGQFAGCLADRVREPAAATSGSEGRPSAEAPAGAAAAAGTAAPAEERAAAAQSTPEAPGALDLVSTVGMPVAKQFAPSIAGLVVGLLLGLLLGHRRRPMIIVVPAAQRAYARPRATL